MCNGLVNHTSSHLKQTAVKASGLTRLNPYKTAVAKLRFLIGLLVNVLRIEIFCKHVLRIKIC
jgi:hypothetical protein